MYLAFWSKWFLESLYNMNPLQGYFGVFLQIHIRLDFKQCAKYGCLLLAKIEKNVDFRLMRNFSSPSFSKSNSFFGICPSIFSIDIFRDSQGTSRQNKKLLIKMSASMASEQHVFRGQTRGTKYHHHHLRLCRCYILMCAFLFVHLE